METGKVFISPSILDSDFGSLRKTIKDLDRCKVDRIHLDVMDGQFVPNITFGPSIISSIKDATSIPFEAHLMIERPERYIKNFVDAGSDIIIVHYEASGDLMKTIKLIKGHGAKAGVAINPQTPFKAVERYLGIIDTVLVMSVHPGFGGQKFIPGALKKIRQARSNIDAFEYGTLVSVDGGINLETGRLSVEAGADEIVAGSAIFKSGNIANAIKELKKINKTYR